MDVFLIQENLILAIELGAAFALGWVGQRLLYSMRERHAVGRLTDQVTRLERQRESAHRVALELAANHNNLVGEHLEAEWTIHSLKSDLKDRDARIEKISENYGQELPSVSREFWASEETVQ